MVVQKPLAGKISSTLTKEEMFERARRFVNATITGDGSSATSNNNNDDVYFDDNAEKEAFVNALYDSVHDSVQRLLESETRVQSLRRKQHRGGASGHGGHGGNINKSNGNDCDGNSLNFALETPPVKGGGRGGGKRDDALLPQIDDCVQFPSLSSSPAVATTPLAKKMGGMSLNGSNIINATNNIVAASGASPSPRRVTPSLVSNGSVERAASPSPSPSSQQQQLPRSPSGSSVVGAPRRIQPSLLSGSSNASHNSNTFANKQPSPVQQQQQQKRIQPTAAKSNNNANNSNEASVETPEYILILAKAYAFLLDCFHDGDIEKSIVDVLKMLSLSPDAFPFGVSEGEAGEEFQIFPSGVFARKFAALVLANAGTLPFSLGPTAIEALSESEAVKAHAPTLAQECANFLSALAASATTVTKIYDDATPSASSIKRNSKHRETDNGRGGAVGTRTDATSVRNPSNKFGLVSRANAHAREKWRDQLVALLSPDAKFNSSSFASSTGTNGAPPSKYYHQNAANAFARKCREVFDSAKSKEDARWLADVFVRKMLKSAGEGETEEDIGAAVSAAKLSALRERLMGGGGVGTSTGAQQHQNSQRHNNALVNGRGSSLGRGSNSVGGGRGIYAGRGGGGAGGRGGGRGNHHAAQASLASEQQQHSNEAFSSMTTTTTTQESSFAAIFQPAFRPYVCVLETADSARFSAAVSRSLADALKALDESYAASVRKGKGDNGVNDGSEEADDILRSIGVNPKDFTARTLAAKCCGKFLGLLRFCLDGYSSVVAFDGLPTIELCAETLRVATTQNELMLTLPWVSEYVKFTPWEDAEEAKLVFSSKGFIDLTSWLRSASKSAKLRVGNNSSSSSGATSFATSRSLRSVEDVSSISAASVRMIRHLVRETLHFKAPTTTAKSLEYAKLASTSQSHPAGPVPKALVANAFDKVKYSVEENDVLADWGANSAAGGHDFSPNVIDDSLLQKVIGVDVERCVAALRNDDSVSNRWSQEEIESVSSQSITHQAAVILPSKQEPMGEAEDEKDRQRVVPVPVRKISPVSAVTTTPSSTSPTKITATKMTALETSPSLPSASSSSTANPTRSLQRAFLAANPRHKNIVDFTVDAAVLASVDHAVRHEIPNALKCVSETLDNACKLAATVSAAEQRRLFMHTNPEQITEKKKMAKPTLEDAWSSAFETAIERATMLALREIGSVIAKRAADDAAQRAGAAAAALLREPSSEKDNEHDGETKKKMTRAPLSPEASAAAAVARDAARQSATERSRLSAPFELRKAIVDEASRKLRVALRNLSSDEGDAGEEGEDDDEEETIAVTTTTTTTTTVAADDEKDACAENDENLVADVQSAALSAIARALSEAQGWAPGSLLAVSRELANARNPRDEIGAKELARMCENCSNAIRSVLMLDESWRDALFTSQQQQKQNAAAVLSSSSAMSPSDAALGPNALSSAAALLAKPSDAPGKSFKKNAEAGRPRDALARALCALARTSMALFLAPPQPALIKPDRHGGVSLSSALVSSAAAGSASGGGVDNNNSAINAALGGNTDGTKQNIGWGVSRDGVCESVRLAVLNAFALAAPILETLDAFAPPDAISVWNEVCGELLFPKNWIPVLRVFPHSPFAQLRIETIVRDVFAAVPDGKAMTARLKKFLETQFGVVSSSEAPNPSAITTNNNNKTTINAMGTSLLLRFLLKLLDARIERYRREAVEIETGERDFEEDDRNEDDDDFGAEKTSRRRQQKKLSLHHELKGWERISPTVRFVARDGPNARSPHAADKLDFRIFELSRIF